MIEMNLAEETAEGTYSVSVRWSGGGTYEVEAESEEQAIELACEKAESGFMESEITETDIEWFDAATEPSADSRTAQDWAGRMEREFLDSGLRRTPVGGVDDFGRIPAEVLRELQRRQGVTTAVEDGITYLVRREAGA